MNNPAGLQLFLPHITKLAVAEANAKILECYRTLRDGTDPAAAMLFGLRSDQYDLLRTLTHSDIRRLANDGLPLWAARFEIRVADGRPEIDRDNVVTTYLKSF